MNRPKKVRVGGFNADVVTPTSNPNSPLFLLFNLVGSTTFGQLPSGSTYNDLGSQDPGGRIIDFQIRFNF